MPRKRRSQAFSASMRHSAESRRCPKCGRKSALVRLPRDDFYESMTYCRWNDCDYERHGGSPGSEERDAS